VCPFSCGRLSAGFAVVILRAAARSSASGCPGLRAFMDGKPSGPQKSYGWSAMWPAARPGQRLLDRLSISTSDDTVLRRVRQKPLQEVGGLPIRNLGVDDWAWRKGQDYGTILVNLDLHRVVDLLPDRAAESFSEWLQRHQEIETISRDRCGIYAEGATIGAPQSQQIADRFHLVLNLSSTMERVLEERSRQLILPPVEDTSATAQSAISSDASTDVTPTMPRPTQSQLRRQRRLERYEQVVALLKSGQSQAAISRALGMERKTIRRWLRRGEFPERKPPHRRRPKVNEFGDYLQQRWNEGCHNASRLYQEIREKGYPNPNQPTKFSNESYSLAV
jgi:transposase